MRSLTVFALALPAIVFATAAPRAGGQCDTGPVQCCNQVLQTNDPTVTEMVASLGIAASDVIPLVGVTCTPITVIGVGGVTCNAQTVCCKNNKFVG
ncbi:Fruiting body protein SC1 [Leucoagaricus sp. SymC.cos]|nr:Fruiting body protein SC1 [Leucoagaricus sp. SymC.cos]